MEIASQRIIEAQVVGTNPADGIPLVELTTLIDGKSRDVGTMLVEKGYAVFRDSPSTSPPSDMGACMASPSP